MTITVPPPPSTPLLHLTVTSLEGLNHHTSFLNPSIKPFITLSSSHLLSTSPRLHHNLTLRVALHPSFFSDTRSSLHLHLFTKRPILGPAQLGSCLIPAHDIGFLPTVPCATSATAYEVKTVPRDTSSLTSPSDWRMLPGSRLTRVALLLGYR
ncbi:hypothetical protein ACSQ67_004898 [Phaseolus vulgaris]